jgi:hypothetical protein
MMLLPVLVLALMLSTRIWATTTTKTWSLPLIHRQLLRTASCLVAVLLRKMGPVLRFLLTLVARQRSILTILLERRHLLVL